MITTINYCNLDTTLDEVDICDKKIQYITKYIDKHGPKILTKIRDVMNKILSNEIDITDNNNLYFSLCGDKYKYKYIDDDELKIQFINYINTNILAELNQYNLKLTFQVLQHKFDNDVIPISIMPFAGLGFLFYEIYKNNRIHMYGLIKNKN